MTYLGANINQLPTLPPRGKTRAAFVVVSKSQTTFCVGAAGGI